MEREGREGRKEKDGEYWINIGISPQHGPVLCGNNVRERVGGESGGKGWWRGCVSGDGVGEG